ncbi:MAG: hypothetical protein EX269_12400 [Acidimicrobiales bacterium]|nr:MAG: hypothetical protein EX269_12400 [Acidimicrobiales bacterium]
MDEPNLVLDEIEERFNAFQLVRKSDENAKNDVLSELGATDDVDNDIILELSSVWPLGHPAKFEQAHMLVVRSLEVLDRNGARGVKTRAPIGPLNHVAGFLVQLVTRFIVRQHLKRQIKNLHWLYARREANTSLDNPFRSKLRRARIESERLEPTFNTSPLGVPTFIFGGAVLSWIFGSLQVLIAGLNTWYWQAVAALFVSAVTAVASWIVVRGAATARHRITLTTDKPIRALYETIGRCGEPPGDDSTVFIVVALILGIIAAVVIPVAFGLAGLGVL